MKWNLTVDVDLKPSFRQLEHADPLLSIGSCFSEHIGSKLEGSRWNICNNPFGILYNPYSVHRALERIFDNKKYMESDLVEFNGHYVSMDHHGDFSGSDPSDVIQRINASIDQAHRNLKGQSTAILTFGTAYFYVYMATGKPVGNCHKIPAKEFERRRMNSDEIIDIYRGIVERLLNTNPDLQLILTVSPVRHWKDGGADNHWSKSILTCAVREMEVLYENVHYFPSYEIMIDELRDHRFYKEDLVHPSDQAIEYIWDRFANSCLTGEAQLLNREVHAIVSRVEHRPIRPDSPEHLSFIEETKRQIGLLKNKYPHLDL